MTLRRRPFNYDDLNRLTRVDEATQAGGGNSWWMSFDYGRYGNRWVSGASNGVALHAATATAQSQYDESKNQLIKQSNGQNLPGNAHDAAGNLQNHPELGAMIFDGQNRLVRHTSSGGVVNMFYDAEGRRVKKTSPNGTVHYIYGPGGQLWAEDGGAGWPGTATRRFLTSDTLGSTRLVTDSTGVVKERRDYHPFGEEIPASTVFGSRHNVTDGGVTTYNEAALVNQRFAGKERDAETGLDYFGARYMSAAQGRFTSADPRYFQATSMVDPQRFNLFSYVRNNPLKWVDPKGESLYLAGNAEWLRRNILYRMAGGEELFNQYFHIENGQVLLNEGVDTSSVNSGLQLLLDQINSADNYLYYAGTSGREAAAIFAGTTDKNGKLNQQGKDVANFFTCGGGIVSGCGTFVGTLGRPGAKQPASLPNGNSVFAVIGYNENAMQIQIGLGAAGSFAQGGIGQRIAPVSFFIHESAENLAFRSQGNFNYQQAHGDAIRREAQIRGDLGAVGGGFAGAEIRTTVPKK